MTYTAPTVNYSTTINGTYTTLTGVQSVSITRGRQRFQDPFPPSSCVIELIPATSYATPLAIGQFIDVRDENDATSQCYFQGIITDVSRSYAIPYDSDTGAAYADRITITAAGPMGVLGSSAVTDLVIFDPSTVDEAVGRIVENSGVYHFEQASTTLASGTTATGASLDYVNKYLQTGQMFIDDLDSRRIGGLFVYIYNNSGLASSPYYYSDTTQTRFKQLEYQSSAQNTFNYIEVNADGFDPQVTSSGTGPYNALRYDTFSYTEADALNLSGYLYNILSGQLTPVPFTISTDTTVAPDCMDVAHIAKTNARIPVISQVSNITFRGTTVAGQIQGLRANFYVDRASVQLFFSPSLGVPFTLGSAVNGVLGQNRLGIS